MNFNRTSIWTVSAKHPWSARRRSFWKTYGEKIAMRNLWCSVPNLTMMFAVWMVWSQLINEMKLAHDKDPHVYSATAFRKQR